MPDPNIDAAAFHHVPEARPPDHLDSLPITHIANAFTNTGNNLPKIQLSLSSLDYMTPDRLNLLEPLDRWRQACAAHLG